MNTMETGTDDLADFLYDLWICLKNFFIRKKAKRDKIEKNI